MRRRASTARRRWQLFRHITLPGLRPVLMLVSILTMTGYFQLFAEPYVMTRRWPAAEHAERALFHVRGRLQVVEPRSCLGGRLPAVRPDVRGHGRAAAGRTPRSARA